MDENPQTLMPNEIRYVLSLRIDFNIGNHSFKKKKFKTVSEQTNFILLLNSFQWEWKKFKLFQQIKPMSTSNYTMHYAALTDKVCIKFLLVIRISVLFCSVVYFGLRFPLQIVYEPEFVWISVKVQSSAYQDQAPKIFRIQKFFFIYKIA